MAPIFKKNFNPGRLLETARLLGNSEKINVYSIDLAGPDQTKETLSDCDGVSRALFGHILTLESGNGWESWKTDRPMRKEGFNIEAKKNENDFVFVQNNGHGGAGVAASWACASYAVEAMTKIM